MRFDSWRVVAWCLTALLAMLCANGAAAQRAGKARAKAKPRVVVLEFEGTASARVRDAVVQALRKSKRYELVPSERAEQTAEQLDADLSTDDGRAAVARELQLSGFVSGAIEKSKRQLVLELRVHGGGSGTQTDDRSFRARKPPQLVGQVRRRFATQLRRKPLELEPPQAADAEARPKVDATEAEPEAEAEREAEPEAEREAEREAEPEREAAAEPRRRPKSTEPEEAEDEDEATAEEAGAAAGDGDGQDWPALELALGAQLTMRSFSYQEPMSHLPEHSVSPTPAGRVQLRAYPGTPFTQGVAAHIGLELYGRIMLPVEAQDGPSIYETTSKGFGGGLRVRIPLWPSEIGIHAGYGAHDVEISNSQFDGDPEVPSVAFRFLRFGADGRVALSSEFALTLRASYLLLLDYGELTDERWFPDASGFGIDAQLGAAYKLGGPFWVEADVGITRYSMTLNVEPAPAGSAVMPRLAEGAVDQHLFGTLGIALRL